MGFTYGDDDDDKLSPEEGDTELVTKVDDPVHPNPINKEVVLTPEVKEHEILSKEMIENKRPWFDEVTKDMYRSSITEIEGSKLYAEFFSNITSPDTVTSGTSKLISAAHQEYIRLQDYPLFLNGELNTDTDATEQKTTTESEMTVVGVLPPQTSDYFVLSTGFNRRSVFKLKQVKPLSIYDDRAYSVTYEMVEAIAGELYDELKRKVVRNLNYIRENHQMGIKYLLTDEEVTASIEDKMMEGTLFAQYVAEFYNHEYNVFGVKTEMGFHTDMIIQNALRMIEACPGDMYTYTEYDETAKLDTIFDALMHLAPNRLLNMMDKVFYYDLRSPTDIAHIVPVLVGPVTSMPFQASSRMMNIVEPYLVTSVIHDQGQYTISKITISDIFPNVKSDVTEDFPNVLRNETYILSEKFYSGSYGNTLEELLRDALANKPIHRPRVMDLIHKSSLLEPEERFFIVPFLIILIKIMRSVR